jgi:hypothetical protein
MLGPSNSNPYQFTISGRRNQSRPDLRPRTGTNGRLVVENDPEALIPGGADAERGVDLVTPLTPRAND